MAYENKLNSGTPMLVFSIITTLYYVIKYNLDDSSNDNTYFLIYMFIVIVSSFFINLKMTNLMCGSNQWLTAFLVTLGPWITIFGLIYLALKTFPSWLMPFSNTFGYGLALLNGLNNTTEMLFKGTESVSSKEEVALLDKIYTDKSLIINEITIKNYPKFWENMKGLFRDEVKSDPTNKVKNDLFKLVKLKELTSEYIWYILSGILISSISYNFIINSSCKKSVQDMQNKFNKDKQEEIELNELKNNKVNRTYIINE